MTARSTPTPPTAAARSAGQYRVRRARDYTRHDGYWKEGLPYFDAIEQILIFDDAARQNALISGEVDYIDAVDLNTVRCWNARRGSTCCPSPAPSITASRWTPARRPSMT
jgi:ABC-type transport system substrate-binding protein